MKILFVAILLSTTAATTRAAWDKYVNSACALQPGGGGGIEGVNFYLYNNQSKNSCKNRCNNNSSCEAYDYATYSGKEGRCRIYTAFPYYEKYKNGVTCWKRIGGIGGDSYEPDDNRWDASVITSGRPQTHSISPIGDQDWTTFTLGPSASGWEVELETYGRSTNDDTVMSLLDNSVSQIGVNDDHDQVLYSKIHRQCGVNALSQGTYYVKVWEYNNDNEINTYDLSFVATKCGGGPGTWDKYSNRACALQPGGGGGILGVNFELYNNESKNSCKNKCKNNSSCEAYDYATYSGKEGRCRIYTEFPYYEKYKNGVTCWKKMP